METGGDAGVCFFLGRFARDGMHASFVLCRNSQGKMPVTPTGDLSPCPTVMGPVF